MTPHEGCEGGRGDDGRAQTDIPGADEQRPRQHTPEGKVEQRQALPVRLKEVQMQGIEAVDRPAKQVIAFVTELRKSECMYYAFQADRKGQHCKEAGRRSAQQRRQAPGQAHGQHRNRGHHKNGRAGRGQIPIACEDR